MAQKIQTLIFSKDNWNVDDARAWVEEHDFRADKVDETDVSYRFRQFDPDDCDGGFQTLTENFPDGVSAVSCELPDSASAKRFGDSPPAGVEYRLLTSGHIELRKVEGEPLPTLVGHAAVVEVFSQTFDYGWFSFKEKIRRGAFARAISEKQDVRALVDHNPSSIIGRTKNGTLELAEDEVGLLSTIHPPDTQAGRDIVTSIERRDVDQMSFGFVVKQQVWTEFDDPNEPDIREIVDVDLWDVSPVTFPAYPDTNIAVRSLEAWRAEFEREKKKSQRIRSKDVARRRVALRASRR